MSSHPAHLLGSIYHFNLSLQLSYATGPVAIQVSWNEFVFLAHRDRSSPGLLVEMENDVLNKKF